MYHRFLNIEPIEPVLFWYWRRKYVQGGAKRQDLDTDMQKEYNRLGDGMEPISQSFSTV